ncbi:hypothetical protein N7481_011717 [Penicillium waksmanii]|uniref:uncharacterized protein n=1 Tax=Penicillium waksmanii TaxID=69791 RepID=UPI0025466FCD|nr:uncharacterized protein N7481_011717 [Penicillium waksmanii]KAJ5974507.1 hypothetical protein N7481_011717 [Penicillium waksmanii]
MALVAYSDSEGSDAEPDTKPAPPTKNNESGGFAVDRSNPRKIRVALPELKPDPSADKDSDDGPARKKPRVGGGGGAFSGFSSFLPAPKRTAEKKTPIASTRKPFSLKTGAERGFDREADTEMKYHTEPSTGADGGGAPTSGSLEQSASKSNSAAATHTPIGEVKLQGNPMMFRPLSVGRPQKKKKTTAAAAQPSLSASAPAAAEQQPTATASAASTAPPPPKPKVSLFSLSSEEISSTTDASLSAGAGAYEPLVYEAETPSAGPTLAPESTAPEPDYAPANPVSSSLNNIANDLNLSKSERRQLFGRNAPSADSRVLTFNTDQEYAHNQALAETELAATQHNPVRAIAPGKHSLQQLVNAAASQKDALEESFASGRRNKKEAGSRYGW